MLCRLMASSAANWAARGVRPFHKSGVIVMLGVGELVVSVAVFGKGVAGSQAAGGKALPHFADLPQLRAGDDGPGLVYHTHHAVDRGFHLVDHILEYPVRHVALSLLLNALC